VKTNLDLPSFPSAGDLPRSLPARRAIARLFDSRSSGLLAAWA